MSQINNVKPACKVSGEKEITDTLRKCFHGYKIIHWDQLTAKRFCPEEKTCLGYVKSLRFHGNPLSDFE